MKKQPNPGSDEAIDKGCTCPVFDNNHGRGVGDPPYFWMQSDCLLHGRKDAKYGN